MENHPPFEIVDKEGFHAIVSKNSGVAVLVYSLDEEGVLDKIGIVTEKNPHFPEKTYSGLVMGSIEPEDPSLLSRAKAELVEESGYDVPEKDRWDFLGEIYTSKLFPESIYCYSVDVTEIPRTAPSGDGSKQEKGIEFSMVPLSKVRQIPDSIFQSCFFKLFMKFHKTDIR
jgi:8-oxo-dGTP pyrophosphatase MutT (NUDIX family)